jgi:hypothetical protein
MPSPYPLALHLPLAWSCPLHSHRHTLTNGRHQRPIHLFMSIPLAMIAPHGHNDPAVISQHDIVALRNSEPRVSLFEFRDSATGFISLFLSCALCLHIFSAFDHTQAMNTGPLFQLIKCWPSKPIAWPTHDQVSGRMHLRGPPFMPLPSGSFSTWICEALLIIHFPCLYASHITERIARLW